MSRVANVVPHEKDTLCEGCGYTLNGLPESGNCPECGKPIAQSTFEDQRQPPTWEQVELPASKRFIRTTLRVLFHPTIFFRTLTTRDETTAANRFAAVHWLISSALFTTAALTHLDWYVTAVLLVRAARWQVFVAIALFGLTYFALDWLTRLASKLTAWEAAYRGMRLPYSAVLRVMHYHSAHYLPVAFIAAGTVVAFRALWENQILGPSAATRYLYVLCAEVIVGAIYLFQTYWIAMRNMMYANR